VSGESPSPEAELPTAHDERAYRRLLRWYPRSWRAENGAVLLDSLREDARRQGWTRPAAADFRAAIVHGLGSRLTPGLALGASVAALALAAGAALVQNAVLTLAPQGAPEFFIALAVVTIVVAPALLGVAIVCLLRFWAVLSDPRSIAVLTLMPAALVCAWLTQLSWSAGFDELNRGDQLGAFGALWGPLFVIAASIGLVAFVVVADALGSRWGASRPLAITIGVVVGLVSVPAIGLSLLTPITTAVAALGVAIFAARVSRSDTSSTSTALVDAGGRPPQSGPKNVRVGVLFFAVLGFLVSIFGIVYALTGHLWSAGATDGTIAMAQGISIALMGGVPILTAWGLWVTRNRRLPAQQWWVPLGFLALSLALYGVAYENSPEWEAMAPGIVASSIAGGIGVAWWLAPRLPARARVRWALAACAAIVYSVFLGIFVPPMAAFLVPVAATVLALIALRRGRCSPPADANAPLTSPVSVA